MNGAQICLRLDYNMLELVCNARWTIPRDNHLVELLHGLLFKDQLDAALWLLDHAHLGSALDVNLLEQDAFAADDRFHE